MKAVAAMRNQFGGHAVRATGTPSTSAEPVTEGATGDGREGV
jgi:hypothetical protein